MTKTPKLTPAQKERVEQDLADAFRDEYIPIARELGFPGPSYTREQEAAISAVFDDRFRDRFIAAVVPRTSGKSFPATRRRIPGKASASE